MRSCIIPNISDLTLNSESEPEQEDDEKEYEPSLEILLQSQNVIINELLKENKEMHIKLENFIATNQIYPRNAFPFFEWKKIYNNYMAQHYTDIKLNKLKLVPHQHQNFKTIGDENNETELIIQSPWIHMFCYGIPSTKLSQNDKDRRFIKVPLKDNDDFTKWLHKFDETVKNMCNKEYTYHNIVQKQGDFPSYFRIKFNENKIQAYTLMNEKYKQQKIKKISDLEAIVEKNCMIRLLMKPKCIWEFDGKTGLSLECTAIQIRYKQSTDNTFND
jgi:hypothetical protein